jgi:hypothetical protein
MTNDRDLSSSVSLVDRCADLLANLCPTHQLAAPVIVDVWKVFSDRPFNIMLKPWTVVVVGAALT